MVWEILSLMPSEWRYSGTGWCWRYNWLLATYLSLQPLSSTEKVQKKREEYLNPYSYLQHLLRHQIKLLIRALGGEESLHAWDSFAELQHFWLLSSSSLAGTPFAGNNDWPEQPLCGSPPQANRKHTGYRQVMESLAKMWLSDTSSPTGVLCCKTK